MSARKYLDDTGLASLWAKIVNKINDLGDLCVKKAGDTMSGVLYRSTNIDTSTTKIGDNYHNILVAKDVNNKTVARFGVNQIHNTQKIQTYMRAETYNTNAPGNYYQNVLNLIVDQNGDESVEVSSPSAWRTALGLSDYVLKAGDTMTGSLELKNNSNLIFTPVYGYNDTGDIVFYSDVEKQKEKLRLWCNDIVNDINSGRLNIQMKKADGTIVYSGRVPILSDVTGLYRIEKITLFSSVVIGANTEYNSDNSTGAPVTPPAISGYIPMEVINTRIYGYYGSRGIFYAWYDITDSKLHFSAYNPTNIASANFTGVVWLLYKKNFS